MHLRHTFAFLAVSLACVCMCGCRKAKIDAPVVQLEPTVSVGALPESLASAKKAEWYQGLMPTASAEAGSSRKSKDKDKDKTKEASPDRPWVPLDTTIEPLKPDRPPEKEPSLPTTTPAAARADAQVLVDELRERIEAGRKEGASWSLLRLDLHAANSDKGKTLALMVDVGLHALYAERPEILFEQVRFEDCMNRLARMADLRYAQGDRWGNPPVTWRGEKVSVYDAVQAITEQHGFRARFAGGGTRFTFPLAKYPSREQFVAEVTSAVLESGKQMEQGLPTLLISANIKDSASKAAPKGAPKAAQEPTKEEPKNVKQ